VVLGFTGTIRKMRISRYLQNKDIHVLIELRRIMIVNYLLPYLNPIIITNSQNNLNQMSNSLELLQGQIQDIQRKYEVLSDIVSEYNGKVHGSQSHVNGSSISLFIYYEVPDGMRDEVKRKFNDFVLSIITQTK
jgi:hypothetical protein